jgi:hypothetical protein
VEFFFPKDGSFTLDEVALHDPWTARGEGDYRFGKMHFDQLFRGAMQLQEESAKLVFAYAFKMKGTKSHNSREYVVEIPLRKNKRSPPETQNVVVHVHYGNDPTKGDHNDTKREVQDGKCMVSGVNIRLLTPPMSLMAVNHIDQSHCRYPRIYLDDKEIQAERYRFKATGGYKWCVDKLGKKRLVSMGRRWRQGSRVSFDGNSPFGKKCVQSDWKTFWADASGRSVSGKEICKQAICKKVVHELQSVKPQILAGWSSNESGLNLHQELLNGDRLVLGEPKKDGQDRVVVEVWIDWEGLPVELQKGYMKRLMEECLPLSATAKVFFSCCYCMR